MNANKLVHLDVSVGLSSGLIGREPCIVQRHNIIGEGEGLCLKEALHQLDALEAITVDQAAAHIVLHSLSVCVAVDVCTRAGGIVLPRNVRIIENKSRIQLLSDDEE